VGGPSRSRLGPGNGALSDLSQRLRLRLGETEEAVRARVLAIADVAEARDPTYAPNLRRSISIALDYALAEILREGSFQRPVPPALLSQARLAARSGVGLDTVMRRYFAGYLLLNDALVEETARKEADHVGLRRALRRLALLVDRVLEEVGAEYQRTEADLVTPDSRRIELVRGLLGGELVDHSELKYDLDCHHVAIVVCGPGADEPLRALASASDCRLLLVRADPRTAWGWLGARQAPDPAELTAAIRSHRAGQPHFVAAFGEPDAGLAGWRLSHRQACAALPIAQHGREPVIRYRDVALVAAALRDEVLTASLRDLYLEPLRRDSAQGALALQTLRAYFAAERNTSSAASALGVSRQTAINRLRSVEELLGRTIGSCATELETALRLDEVARPPHSP